LQSNFSAVERARNTIGNAAVFAYLQTLRKIADIAGQKERREEYAKISLEFFKDYPKDYKTAQNMALAGIMEIDALPPAIRETSLRCIRYFCDKAEFTCRAAQNPRLYFLDAVSNIISANKKNPSEAQTFLKEILEYNPESSKSKYLGGQDEL
jgi:hypothetical protein